MPSGKGMDLTIIPDPIMAAIETPKAIQPDLATMLNKAGVLKTMVADAAVIPMLPTKYTERG